jgi:hypothetical protein
MELLHKLHPVRNLMHHGPEQEWQIPAGVPTHINTAQHVILAAHTSPRGSPGGPDGVALDLLTRPLLGVDAAV